MKAVCEEFGALHETIADIGDNLPVKIGNHAGAQVGGVLQPKLNELMEVLQALGSTGKEAVCEAMKANMA